MYSILECVSYHVWLEIVECLVSVWLFYFIDQRCVGKTCESINWCSTFQNFMLYSSLFMLNGSIHFDLHKNQVMLHFVTY